MPSMTLRSINCDVKGIFINVKPEASRPAFQFLDITRSSAAADLYLVMKHLLPGD
jgi:hypothetical protein